MFDQTYITAFVRSLIGGAINAGAVFFATLGAGGSAEVAGIAAGTAFFGVLATRFGGEGTLDSHRARLGTEGNGS